MNSYRLRHLFSFLALLSFPLSSLALGPGDTPEGFTSLETILIDQKGEVLYRHAGVIDPTALKTKILEALTPYHQPAPAKK